MLVPSPTALADVRSFHGSHKIDEKFRTDPFPSVLAFHYVTEWH